MTEAMTREAMQKALVMKCWKDPEFKQQVMSNPKGMLESYLGKNLPAGVRIFVHEESPDAMHLSIPPAPGNVSELSDEELEKVAGGTDLLVTIATAIASIASFGVMASGVMTEGQGW